jgi:hypothetical protein
MTYSRESLICLQATPYYDGVSRCVRACLLLPRLSFSVTPPM